MALIDKFKQISEFEFRCNPFGEMRVPAVIYSSASLLDDMEDKVFEQLVNTACLPGVVRAVYAMPDAHSGYGFPIGGVAAVDPDLGGVISAGGVGFDIACGVRTLTTGLGADEVLAVQDTLADRLFAAVPSGVGSTSSVHLSEPELDDMLSGGAAWAVNAGFGVRDDLIHLEEHGRMVGARPDFVSGAAKKRQRNEMGTLGSGNHYLEVQVVDQVYDDEAAAALGIREGEVLVSIHCGSRGLGHQVATEYSRAMRKALPSFGITLPDPELACAPIRSELGRKYLGAMRGGINCAMANRQIITQFVRQVFDMTFTAHNGLPLVYEVCHNTCREEMHRVNGAEKQLFVHRKGATRAFPPGHPELDESIRDLGQPVLIGGSMGSSSHILAGVPGTMERGFASTSHGAGRSMSRAQARKKFKGRDVLDSLKYGGTFIRSGSFRGIAEEAPGAYKDIDSVIRSVEGAGLARRVARVRPVISVKG